MDLSTKRDIIETMIQADRPDLANIAAVDLEAMPVKEYTAEEITAASLSRIFRHFSTNDLETGIAIVSADRSDRAFTVGDDGKTVIDIEVNAQHNRRLRSKLQGILKSFGSGGYIKTKGGWKEGDQVVYEQSYVVPGVTREEAVRLAKILGKGAAVNGIKDAAKKVKQGGDSLSNDFRQDAIIWGNNKAGALLVWHNGRFEKLGQFKLNNIKNVFTEWKRRRFTFGCHVIEYVPNSPSDYREWRAELAGEALT